MASHMLIKLGTNTDIRFKPRPLAGLTPRVESLLHDIEALQYIAQDVSS
jgi:hypothetical protein